MNFKENLKLELAYQDMQVKELAEISGISRHTIGNYLSVRERIPTADVAVKIAKALGVTVEYLVTGRDIPQDKPVPGPDVRALVQNFKLLCEDDQKMIMSIVHLFKNQGRKNRKN